MSGLDDLRARAAEVRALRTALGDVAAPFAQQLMEVRAATLEDAIAIVAPDYAPPEAAEEDEVAEDEAAEEAPEADAPQEAEPDDAEPAPPAAQPRLSRLGDLPRWTDERKVMLRELLAPHAPAYLRVPWHGIAEHLMSLPGAPVSGIQAREWWAKVGRRAAQRGAA